MAIPTSNRPNTMDYTTTTSVSSTAACATTRKPTMTTKPQDPYASEQETIELIKPDTRTPYAKMLDQMLEIRGANEQGAEPYKILYRITVELLEAYYHGTEEQP
jgi:hypothetical protein